MHFREERARFISPFPGDFMVHCPNCHTEYADDLQRCPNCGEESAEGFVCGRCGEEYRGGDACPVCGAIGKEQFCARHADRQAVGLCVICGTSVCEECAEGEHHAYLCPEHRTVPVIQGWAQVYSTNAEFDAQLVRENLLSEGIDAQIFSQKDRILTVDLGELAIVRVLVPVWEYGPALQLIRDHMDTEGEVGFACPACGEAYEPEATECTNCGAALV